MKIFALPDEYVKKVSFIADRHERDLGFRPCDISVISGCISYIFDGLAESMGHGICEGDDE